MKQNPRYIFGSLVRQLIAPLLDVGTPHAEHINALRERDSQRYNSAVPSDVLIGTLKRIATSFDRVCVIIDGLDECENRELLLRELAEFHIDNVCMLVTSRPEDDIQRALKERAKMTMEEGYVQHDIAIYIDWMLENDDKLNRMKSSLKYEIKDILMGKSGGMYSYAL
jgi:hypothetical protein